MWRITVLTLELKEKLLERLQPLDCVRYLTLSGVAVSTRFLIILSRPSSPDEYSHTVQGTDN